MTGDKIKIFYDLLKEDDYCLLYNGNFIDTVTSKIITVTKVSLIQRGDLIKTQNRFAYLIAECFQNIIRHGGHKYQKFDDKPLPGFFMAKIRGNIYNIITANLVENKYIPAIKNRFDDLNSRTYDELKILYKKVMAEGQLSDKGGAGLGLIDMAKKSSQKIEYKFIDTDGNLSMFYNQVVMNSDYTVKNSNQLQNGLEIGIQIHNAMVDNDVLLLQKSDFSKDIISPLFRIIELNIISKSSTPNLREIYLVLIDFLMKIARKGLKKSNREEGIFLISRSMGTYQICLGNIIDNRKVDGLRRFVKRISELNSIELDDFYYKTIQGFDQNSKVALKKGVVDIGSVIAEKFTYDFHQIDDDITFFSIQANI